MTATLDPAVDTRRAMAVPARAGERTNPYCTHQHEHLYCAYSAEQHLFHGSRELEVFFGGAAGPGKTMALLCEGLRQVHLPAYRAIFFRRSYPELAQVEEFAGEIFPHLRGRYNQSQHVWTFPSGARYRLAYCERDKDKLRYQGHSFAYIAWDELTQYPNDSVYTYLFTRCRPFRQARGIMCYIRSASNPGGPGHSWVYERFIEKAEPFKTRTFTTDNGGVYQRLFIPATLDSNDILLLANNRQYETLLLSHPDPEIRRALRLGDWSIASGVLFSEVRRQSHQQPARAPRTNTTKMIAMDWGWNHDAVALWVESDSEIAGAASRVFQEYITHETPPPIFAQQVVSRSIGMRIRRAVLDPSAWNTPQDGGPSPAEQMEPIFRAAGITLERAAQGPEKRVVRNQIALLHTYFWPHRAEGPLLQVMDNCPTLWRQLTTIVRGEPPEDRELPAKGQTDDAMAALRYWAASRPEPPAPKASEILRAMLGDVYERDPRTAVATALERAKRKRLAPVQDLLIPKIRRRNAWERM